MFASRLVVSFLAFGAIVASATPTTLQKRTADVSDALDIVSTLGSTVAPFVNELNEQAASGTATKASVTSPVIGIFNAFDGASRSLTNLGTIDTTSGGSAAEVIDAVEPIISNVLTSLKAVNLIAPGSIAASSGVLADEGSPVSEILEGLVIAVDSVLNLLSGL